MPVKKAERAAQGALSRIPLLHIVFSRIPLEEYGEKKGKNLVTKAILDYGERTARRVQKDLPDLTPQGLYEEEGETDDGKPFVNRDD